MRYFLAFVFSIFAAAAQACETALILTIDVSNSVDESEWLLQRDGLADAMRDPEVIEAMIQSAAAVMVVQWSGEDKQEVSIPWQRTRTALDVESFQQKTRLMQRAFTESDTAPAEAIYFSLAQFADVSDCKRRVIDVSGDGTPNSGNDTRSARNAAERAGVTINGVAIESLGIAITGFYQRGLVTRDGFVITARRHSDYPRAIRAKLIRELARVLG